MKRRKRYSFVTITLILAAVGIIGFSLWYLIGRLQFQTYTSQQNGFSISYPSDWEAKENVNGALVIFYSPLENQLDFFRDNINVVIQDISGSPMNLDQYSKVAVDQMKLVFGDNMKVEELSDTSVDGMPAKRLVFLGKGPQSDLKYMSVWALDGTTVYQLTYLAVASQYKNHLFSIRSMINSFHRIPRG